MPKQYNTSSYRYAKRVVAFIDPKMKKRIEAMAKIQQRSVSNIVGVALSKFFGE